MTHHTLFHDLNTTASQLQTFLDSKVELSLTDINPQTSALIIVDMINGFVKEGPLASSEALKIIPSIASLLQNSHQTKRAVIAFADEHPQHHAEFLTYPPHCIKGTPESAIISELQAIGGYQLIPKNSTNGFVTPAFQSFLTSHPHLETFIIVGTCTDICVEQFALSLQAAFNEKNLTCRLIVPLDGVATYDAPHHPATLMNALSLCRLEAGGIEIIKSFLD